MVYGTRDTYFTRTNIQREEILPSEKAYAYKMKLEAMKRSAGRPTKENACQSGTHLRSDQELASQVGEKYGTEDRKGSI